MYPARKTEYLSAAFEQQLGESELELAVTVINLNYGNKELLEACKLLKECIEEGILADFLSKNRAEVISVSIFEYDEEKHMRFVREEGYVEGELRGKAEGKAEAILELVGELGFLSENLAQTILNEKNSDTLSKWIRCAAKAESVEEFMEKM